MKPPTWATLYLQMNKKNSGKHEVIILMTGNVPNNT